MVRTAVTANANHRNDCGDGQKRLSTTRTEGMRILSRVRWYVNVSINYYIIYGNVIGCPGVFCTRLIQFQISFENCSILLAPNCLTLTSASIFYQKYSLILFIIFVFIFTEKNLSRNILYKQYTFN